MKSLQNKVAEIQVSYHPLQEWKTKPQIIKSSDAYDVLIKYFPIQTIALVERFVVLYTNRNNRVTSIYHMSSGGMAGTVADIRLILVSALKTASSGIIIAHNHPSGNVTPSSSDKHLTNQLYKAAKFLDLKLLDHLILSPDNGKYYSFSDEGDLVI